MNPCPTQPSPITPSRRFPATAGLRLNCSYERQLPDGWQTNRYNYQVVRLWQEDPEPYLTAQVNLVPLVPLTNVPESEEALRGLVRRMAERINAEPQPRAAKFWTATCLLMGLRFS